MGGFSQVRVGEFLRFIIDTSGNTTSPITLDDAIDLNGAGDVAVTVTVTSASTNGGTLRLRFRTAPINNDGYYADTGSEDRIDISADTSTPRAYFLTTNHLSRFFLLEAQSEGSNPSGSDLEVVCTIDVVARGCSG